MLKHICKQAINTACMCKENQNILMLSQRITFRLHKLLVDHVIKKSLGNNAFLCFFVKFPVVRLEYGGWFAQPVVMYVAEQKRSLTKFLSFFFFFCSVSNTVCGLDFPFVCVCVC